MAFTSTTIRPGPAHALPRDPLQPFIGLLELSEAVLRASGPRDGVRRALEALRRWPGALGARIVLRNDTTGQSDIDEQAGAVGTSSLQVSSPVPGDAVDGPPMIVTVELWGAEPADQVMAVSLPVAAAIVAHAVRALTQMAELTRLRHELRVAHAERPAGRRMAPARPPSLAAAIGACEREVLVRALRAAGGNRAKAARLVSTTERIFNYKARKHGIDWRAFRRKGG